MMPWLWFGVGEQCKRMEKWNDLTLWDPTLDRWHFSIIVPQALLQSPVLLALWTKFGALSTLIMFCAPGTTNHSLCSVNFSLPSSWSASPSFCWWPDFLGRNLQVPSLLELSNLWRNCSWSLMPPLVSPNGNWAEPSSTWSHHWCTVWWCSTLSKSACQPLLKSHTFTGVVLQKGDDFCMALRLATSWPTCCLSLLCFGTSSHQP